MSFGGMLTGGDEEVKEVQKTVMPKEEINTTPSLEIKKSEEEKEKEKVLANNIKVNE